MKPGVKMGFKNLGLMFLLLCLQLHPLLALALPPASTADFNQGETVPYKSVSERLPMSVKPASDSKQNMAVVSTRFLLEEEEMVVGLPPEVAVVEVELWVVAEVVVVEGEEVAVVHAEADFRVLEAEGP
ncbi:hypothetical protein CCACVL1_07032 [Corchorus capsularis]|uniref:Uncharacterized protein n=1 Tax=Corchorus capsularis TaxID=210143 RepID=A0A1R3JAC7_COCAP|nr:hypothetical protein CCACVL1_07032 [Corchorus capsularis]